MIDLRSDTVTRPSAEMRQAMADAPVGDDFYGEDPSIQALEERVAQLLGKEDATFVPTGTMANQIAMRAHTEPGSLILMDSGSHMVLNEVGGAAAFSGLTVRPVRSHWGIFQPEAVEEALEVPHPFNPSHLQAPPAMLAVENTQNTGGGVVWPLETLQGVADVARRHGLTVHMDGARLWNATVASGVSEADYAAPFDTVSVCFSKGLGAPVGSALAGTAALVDRARRFRQQVGGGMRQAGIIAAGALYAMENNRTRLEDDHANARTLAEGLASTEGIEVDLGQVQSNIVRFRVTAMEAGPFVEACHAKGVHMLPGGAHGVRAVTHLDVSSDDVAAALEVMRSVVKST